MPLDAICMQAVVRETAAQIENARIEKIQQPARDQVILLLRGGRRLLLNAGASQPRLHLTWQLRDNPAQPPMFCMLLRKHLAGGRLLRLEQEPLERVVTLTIRAVDELGEQSDYRLILEAMPRHANLILVDREGRIVDCLRRVDFEMSQQRQVLPGLYYHLPPRQDKCDPLTTEEDAFRCLLARRPEDSPLDRWLMDTFTAIPPLLARELVCRTCGETDARSTDPDTLWQTFHTWQQQVQEGRFLPQLLEREGRPADFSYFPVTQYGPSVTCRTYDTFAQLLDDFYQGREQADRVRQKGQDLMKAATAARDRVRRKLALQEKEYAAARDRESLRLSGELITANLYRMERGAARLETENFYDPECRPVAIPLDPLLTPQQNAAKYYKRYTKAKTAEKYLAEQMALARRDLDYLESVLEELSRAETEQDFLDIRGELRDAGFLRRQGKKEQNRPAKPLEFRTTSGFRVLVGRNNRQNDKLTRSADHRDIWLHTQKIHGSHVILCTGGREVDDDTIVEAAKLAAWFSQAREGANVPVDYTPVKNVKKPAGARPGMVIYSTCRTVNVAPEEGLVKKLQLS